MTIEPLPNGEDKSSSRYLDPTKWEGVPVPERRWIVPGWLPLGEVTTLYGPPGTGKSLLALQLMVATAIEKRWAGLPTKTVRSIGIFCEDNEEELHRRFAAINALYGCRFAELGAMRAASRVGEDNLLMYLGKGVLKPTPLLSEFFVEAREFGARLWIFDTAADGFGGDQNNMHQVRRFIHTLARFARAIDGAVVLVAHPSRFGMTDGSGYSGSVQWDAAVRSRLYLEEPKPEKDEAVEPDARILTRKKANYAARGDAVELTWSRGVLTTRDDRDEGPWPDAETIFLTLLDRARKQKMRPSPIRNSPYYAPKMFKQNGGATGYRVRILK